MAVKRVSAADAVHLRKVGYVAIDVRTPGEYKKGHPVAAINVPWMLVDGFGMKDNPHFLEVVEGLYPDKEQKFLVVGKIGKRSLVAAEALEKAGYVEICELRPGYVGIVDDRGRFTEQGWDGLGLPTEVATEGGSYREIRERLGIAAAPKTTASTAPRPSQAPPGIKRVSAKEAVPLGKLGYVFIDVRDPGEYAKGHPKGAINIPWQFAKGFEMRPNEEFVSVVEALYPDKEHKLLLVGKIGKRSMAAAQALLEAGYSSLVELRPGFLGLVDDRGRYTEDGWKGLGLPSENATDDGSWAELKERVADKS